ncbi:MAG: hypothetical protein IJN30_00985 [Bacteroidales bacterium]|nr:hypothetical protein [Bacteroidales bacterium]
MKRILLLVITVITFCTITSCSKENADNSFVGTWQCDAHYYGGSDVYDFKKDGTYTWRCPGWNSESGVYSYTSSTITFSQYTGRTRTYILLSKTNKTFVIMDEDGYSYTYFRK